MNYAYKSGFLACIFFSFSSVAEASDNITLAEMSRVDEMYYNILKQSVDAGEKSKIPRSIRNKCGNACAGYNEGNSISNEILKQEMRKLEEKYNNQDGNAAGYM